MILLTPTFPRQANHANVEFFAGIFILALLSFKQYSRKAVVTPTLATFSFRVVTFAMYFYAGFHKLNRDFFDASVSCANEFGSEKIIRIFNSLGCGPCSPIFTQLPYPALTVFVEMVVPFGLFHSKTRKAAVAILLLFHTFLSIYGFSNFSALAIFLLTGSCIDFTKGVSIRTLKALRIYVAATLIYTICHFLRDIQLPGFRSASVTMMLSAAIFSGGAFFFFYIFLKENKSTTYSFTANQLPILLGIFICISFWALRNYIGLGTIGNFTMFRNLVTEKSRNNRLLIDTRKTKIWDFEEDYVQIIELDNRLKWQKSNSRIMHRILIPMVEFGTMIDQWSEQYSGQISCTLIHNGEKMTIPDLRTSRFGKYRWWYHFLPFRVIQVDGANKCRW